VQAVEGKNPQQAWLDFISEQILPQRLTILRHSLPGALQMGWQGFERVYDIQRGGPQGRPLYTLKKLKPLLHEITQILVDRQGNYAGLLAEGELGVLLPNKSWIVSNEVEAGNLYGMSRHEGSFDPWIDSQYSRVRRAMLAMKLSGIVPVIKYRPGKSPAVGGKLLMDDGQTPAMDNEEIAVKILNSLFGGKGVVVPTTEYTDEALQSNPKLAESTSWSIEFMDAGNYSTAMAGMIAESEYTDKNKVRGWRWPERAVLEATTAGSRADSQSHTSSISLDLELLDNDQADQITQGQPTHNVPGVVDELLALNFGEQARGTVKIVPAPLSDPKVELYTKMIEAVMANSTLAPVFAKVADWGDIYAHMDIKIAGEGDLTKEIPSLIDEAVKAAAEAKKPPIKPGGTEQGSSGGQNGNGNRMQLSRSLYKRLNRVYNNGE
jgi:hypothetical protein